MTGTRRKKDYFYAKCVEQSDLQEKKLYLNQRVGCIRVVDGVYPQFLVIALQNTEIRKTIFERETGAVNQGNLVLTISRSLYMFHFRHIQNRLELWIR